VKHKQERERKKSFITNEQKNKHKLIVHNSTYQDYREQFQRGKVDAREDCHRYVQQRDANPEELNHQSHGLRVDVIADGVE
jgi:hypothetical protein